MVASSNPTSLIMMLAPVIVLAVLAKVLELTMPAKRERRSRSKDSLSSDDSGLRGRVAQLEKMLEGVKNGDATAKRSTTGSLAAEPENIDFRLSAKRYFFSRAENEFFKALAPIATSRGYVVFSKVKLADVFEDDRGAQRVQSNYYSQLHIDYLLVTQEDFQPVLGIELNGPSHLSNEQQYRDRKKRAVFSAAKLPLLNFYNEAFTVDDIEQKLDDALASGSRLTSTMSKRTWKT